MLLPLALIAAAQFFSFGVFGPALGFYYDDWVFLDLARRGGGFFGAMREFFLAGYATRPLEILQFPLFYRLGGLDPSAYHLLILYLETAEAVLFFVLLDRLLGSRKLATIAAVMAAIYPNRSILHVWMASSPQTVALVLILASLVLFERGRGERRLGRLAVSQLLYVSGILAYESPAFLPLLLAGGWAGRGVAEGKRWKEAVWGSVKDIWPYGASLALALLCQRLAASAASQPNPKALAFSLGHASKAFGAGFECLTNRVLHLCWKSLPGFFADSGAVSIVLWLALGVGAAAALGSRQDDAQASPAAGPVRVAACAAVLGFIGAYLPYAVSGSYVPQIFGSMSRTNGGGALVGGLLVALAAAALERRPALQRSFLALVTLAFTAANWQVARQYSGLWIRSSKLLSDVAAVSVGLPRGSTVLLEQVPRPGQPPAFAAHFDISAALRLRTGRSDLSADVVTDRMDFAAGNVVARTESGVRLYAYRDLYAYVEQAEALFRLDGPP